MTSALAPLVVLAALLALGLVGAAVFALRARRRTVELESEITRLEAEREAVLARETKRRLESERRRLEKGLGDREAQIARREERLERRQQEVNRLRASLDERAESLDARSEELAGRAESLDARTREFEERDERLRAAEGEARARLEEIAGLSSEEARERLLVEAREDIRHEVARTIQKADEHARLSADERARALVLDAIATLRGSVVGEGTVSLVSLPSDEMKGRVIGREGRNIRALEQAMGVDLLVDDTPEAILISSWDPLRRTIATRALGKLVEDGRIHPARIEEVVERTREEADEEARDKGERCAYEVGVAGLHERLVLLLGRLAFHTEEGESLLMRAREVALVAGSIADEMRLDGDTLRRAGLLHEVARADEAPLTEHFALASADLAQRFGEKDDVTMPIRALAQPPDTPRTPAGVIMVTARRLVVSRPGARDENLQRFMDRLEEAEKIALSREGVERAYAVRAGRELRVHVRAESFDDDRVILLARELAREIEARIDYPGQVRVLVLRETRAVSYAV